MGERKVINKYIPADFDPSLIPRGKKLSSKDGTVPVRMMLPFSMQCETCHTFLYRGRKYNSKKEPVAGPEGRYLGIQRFRFYIKCQHCSRSITFTTDPKNADYEMESGASRNFELHANTKKEHNKKKHDNTDAGDTPETEDAAGAAESAVLDPVQALEHRILDSQREMADLDNLEEIKAMNARHLKIDPLEALQLEELTATEATTKELLTEEDEALIQSIQFGKQHQQQQIHRLTEDDEARLDQQRQQRWLLQQQQAAALLEQQQQQSEKLVLHIAIQKKKRRHLETNPPPPPTTTTIPPEQKRLKPSEPTTKQEEDDDKNNAGGGGLSSLLGGYGSDDDSD